MKDSLDHLPEKKQAELRRIVPIIREMCKDVEMIILFGSYARGDYKEAQDLAPDRKSGDVSDYDIMVVCREKTTAANHALLSDIEKRCNEQDPDEPFRIIVHDIRFLQERLKEIHYFFSDVVREGCLLYTSGEYELEVGKELTPEQRLKAVTEHFEHWFSESKEFYQKFEYSLSQDHKTAAFDLHQAAESAYKALLLVFTNYTPYNHFLSRMNKQTREVLPGMEEIFPCKTKADEDLFKLFDYAYIGARYDPKYQISKEELAYLSGRVRLLLELTEKHCREKIESLKA